MKTLYKPLPAIAPQNVTLLLGEDTGMNIDASLAHAIELVSSERFCGVLYLNTVQTPRSMYESARSHGLDPSDAGICEVHGNGHALLQIINVPRGDLHKSREKIDYFLSEGRIQTVIVNSWEFAAKNSRYREEAVFLFKELTSGMCHSYEPASVIVYGEELQKKTRAQKIERGGFGKLAALAKKVECISIKQEFVTESEIIDREEMISQYRESSIVGIKESSGMDFSPSKKTRTEVRATEVSIDNSKTSIEELRATPIPLSKLPIHLNSYSADKQPATNTIRPSVHTSIRPSPAVHSDVIQK